MSLPKWVKQLGLTDIDSPPYKQMELEKLVNALSIAWEALEQNVEFNMRDAEGPELRAQNEGNYRRSKEAMRRIEEMK